jgi:uncharacterized protein YmfQ (DUF2313 family)
MGMSAADYLAQAQALMPPGPAWPREAAAYQTRLLLGLSESFARVQSRASSLLDEADPRTTAEMLLDWERVAGLPDGCVVDSGMDPSSEQRRAALIGRLTMQGAQSIDYFEALAASLGYTVTVSEFEVHDVDDDVSAPINSMAWAHVWQVQSVLNQPVYFYVTSSVADPLASWSNVILECVLNRFKPAHSVLLFSYI